MGQQICWVGLLWIEHSVSERTVLVKLILTGHVLLIKSVIFYSGQCDFLLLLTDTLLHLKALENFHRTSS